MRLYLDSSVAVHAVLPGGDRRARAWIDATRKRGDEVFSSVLLHLELTRVLRRERLDVALARPLLDRVAQVSIDDGVVRFAAAIEPNIRSLDSIHVATCALLGGAVTLVTHDLVMRQVAEHLGIDVVDPLVPER